MFFVHLRDLSFIWPFREANTRKPVIFFFKNILTSIKLMGISGQDKVHNIIERWYAGFTR